jgi:NADP-dependent 3-hydroxy acid dehydrogenase YdfG
MSRIAVVTGASSGIGRACATRLAKGGFRVLAAGRRVDALAALAREASGIVTQSADLAAPGQLLSLLNAAQDHFAARPSVVVLSAGRGLRGTLLSSDPTQWEEVVRINQLSMMAQLRESAEYLLACPASESPSDIVVLGSTVGRHVSAANPVYGATKFALHSLCESLRQEVCDRGIRVSLIEPGFVKSRFQETAGYDPKWFASLERESGPFLVPEDIAAAVSFVVSQPPHVHVDDIRIRPVRQKV